MREREGRILMEKMKWSHAIFMTFLLAASWQDLRNKSVSIWLYLGYGAAVVLLAAGRLTSGAIGSGDGMFFIVSGLYLSLNENIRLLLNGILWGGVFCLFLFLYGKKHGRNIHRMAVPFLPFLIPGWIWMVIS